MLHPNRYLTIRRRILANDPKREEILREIDYDLCANLEITLAIYGGTIGSIYIPNSVTTIEYRAFYNCSNLTIYCEASSRPSGWDSSWNSSNLPVVWSSYLGIHGSLANFNYVVCLDSNGDKYIRVTEYIVSVTYAVIPESINIDGEDIPVKEIGEGAFTNSENLISIVIPDNVTTIGGSAFYNCSNLKAVTISENSQLTSIESYAFRGCSSLTSIYIPDSVTTIGGSAFYNCSNLKAVTISENSQLTSIESYAFHGCSSLTSIYIPDSVTTIGGSAFYNCSNLKAVTISENSQLTSIESYAFRYCSSLTSIYIPDSVTTIGERSFEGCSSLTIYCEASSRPSGWSSYWNYSNYSNRPVVWNCTYDEYLDTIAYDI